MITFLADMKMFEKFGPSSTSPTVVFTRLHDNSWQKGFGVRKVRLFKPFYLINSVDLCKNGRLGRDSKACRRPSASSA